MKKRFLGAVAFFFLMAAPVVFTACGDDDDDKKTTQNVTITADAIVGVYTGKMKPIGYTDAPATAYVEVTRMSATSVKVKISCSEFSLDMDPLIMVVTPNGAGQAILAPEKSTLTISGSYTHGSLNITFQTGANITFTFSGSRQ